MKESSIPLQIILHLKKADKALIANHIARGLHKRPQLIAYHLNKLVNQDVVLTKEEYGHTYYLLQPSFYLEAAETALMSVLTPWIEQFSKQTSTEYTMTKEEAVFNNLYFYFLMFLKEAQTIEEKSKSL